jgi:Spy/CpxP family protein refolding chaperone
MKAMLPRLGALALGTILLTAAYNRMSTASTRTEAANRFLASLTPEQKAKATFQFADAERMNWFFVPIERKGLQLREMQPHQKHLASALLSAGLSQSGYFKAVTIMSLEDILRIMEKDSGERRNPEKYYFSIFGTPGEDATWGYRVEGHHLSQNFTVVRGKVVAGPSFYGTNPAEVREGPRSGLRVLGAEEDLARELVKMLDAEQQKTAIFAATAPKDIITMNSRKAAIAGQPTGILASKLNSKQFEKLNAVIQEYTRNVPDQVASAREDLIKKAGKNIHFAWAGGVNKGDPHYYRVQAATFLIEYDNTQNGANHVHSVWRELTGDWGEDLLKGHYEASHK